MVEVFESRELELLKKKWKWQTGLGCFI